MVEHLEEESVALELTGPEEEGPVEGASKKSKRCLQNKLILYQDSVFIYAALLSCPIVRYRYILLSLRVYLICLHFKITSFCYLTT